MKKVVNSFLGMLLTCCVANTWAAELLFNPTLTPGDVEIFGNLPEVGAINDTASFTLAQEVNLTFSNFQTELENPLPPPTFLFEIDGLETALVDSSGNVIMPVLIGSGLSGIRTLGPGSYSLQITGDAVGDIGGLYNGVIAVSAVPIPAAGLLFFSGIAALGLVRSRRAKTTA